MTQTGQPTPRDNSLSGWHYLLLFTSFGLVVLTLASKRYEQMQIRNEQRFKGIQELQLHPPGAHRVEVDSVSPLPPQREGKVESEPVSWSAEPRLMISLRPLMVTLSILMLLAWAGIQWRQRHKAQTIKT